MPGACKFNSGHAARKEALSSRGCRRKPVALTRTVLPVMTVKWAALSVYPDLAGLLLALGSIA